MAFKTVYDGVIFIEGKDPRVSIKGNVNYKYGSIGSQLKSLNDVKKALAYQAQSQGCNCIVEFEYGQKSSWFSLDDMKWFGNGKCGTLSEEDYQKLIEELNS